VFGRSGDTQPFQRLVAAAEKPLKRLNRVVASVHRAKATVLMRKDAGHYEISGLSGSKTQQKEKTPYFTWKTN
jgi:hypothetical protein